jgi:hypothetical protein
VFLPSGHGNLSSGFDAQPSHRRSRSKYWMLKFLKRFPAFPTANPVDGLKLCFQLKRHHTAEALSGAIFVA